MKNKRLMIQVYILVFSILFSCHGISSSATNAKHAKTIHQKIGDTVDSLPPNIWVVFQDSKDRLWFGTNEHGTFCYDGKSIINYSKKHGLPSNQIRGIKEDVHGNLLISSVEGITKFDGTSLRNLPIVESNEWRLDSTDLWFSIIGKPGENGPYRYDGKVLHHLRFPKHPLEESHYAKYGKHSWSPYEPYSIYKDRIGNIWFGTAELGVFRYDGNSISWLYEEHLTQIEGGGSFGIRSMVEDLDGKFWFCNTKFRFQIHNDSIRKDFHKMKYLREKGIENISSAEGRERIYFMSAVTDVEGNLWMLTYDQGVWKYDGKTTTHFPVEEDGVAITLFSIYQDRSDQLWLGSHENGVYQFNGESFEKFIPTKKPN